MGHSDEPPYMYDNISSRRVAYPYSNFNPKAVTQASYASLASSQMPPVKREGPLINFNQHPDSYMIVPGHNLDCEPMPANTKKKVKILRWLQLFLRVHQELGAAGLLVATICITQTQGAITYLLRVPPAWDTLVTLYSVVHLSRPAKARTPASSASYHFFSLFTDAAILPFYAFMALVANNNLQGGTASPNSWSSFFGSGAPLTQLQQAIWLGSAAVGGLHLISCFLDIWLTLIFRNITRLPPDMNPLEDNLTSRRSVKHKHKNSEYTLASDVSTSEKKSAFMSGSTLDLAGSEVSRNIPFGQSRNDSSTNLAFSPHNPESARKSRAQFDRQLDGYNDTAPSPRSRFDAHPVGSLDARPRGGSRSPTKDRARSNMGSAMGSETDRSSYFTDGTMSPVKYMDHNSNAASSHLAIHEEQKGGLMRELPRLPKEDRYSMPTNSHVSMATSVPSHVSRQSFAPPKVARHDSFDPASDYHNKMRNYPLPQPLGMNPPTPPPQMMPLQNQKENVNPNQMDTLRAASGIDRSLTVTSNVTNTSSVYSESAPALERNRNEPKHQSMPNIPKPGTPKGKHYGDLASATRGVRGNTPTKSPGRGALNPANIGGYGVPQQGNVAPSQAFMVTLERHSRSPSPTKSEGPFSNRVVSRSGADIADQNLMQYDYSQQPTGFGMRSRRDVSGKVAEEGRGGNPYR
ncbi:Hypothetical protein R9X50_00008300 [Acrodontium crateriforme]|uniref:Uncharacterized protein n=1 Tax=Acrodontium crateriforme TaxID=150365 RepID=A0AAQ3LWT9_9PEZI|nr:Hypothetical protein R9X50_00008300 [Acrodontium crateriforme]